MNKSAIFFIIVIFIGLASLLFVSVRNNPSQDATSNTSLIATPSPRINVPQNLNTTPTPTFVPVSAKTAVIKTVKGEINIDLYPQDAPKTVTNFATLATNKYYDGLTFHRVEPGFVIQGGDPNGNGSGGYSIYGDTFPDELNADTASYKAGYVEGTVAMANRGPNTNGSQFFIMWADRPDLPRNYTIFGKVTKGMDVVRQMVAGDKITSITVQ